MPQTLTGSFVCMKEKHATIPLLMMLTMLVIISFQLYKLLQTGSYLSGSLHLPAGLLLSLAGVTIVSFLILYRNLLLQRRLTDMKNDFISNISHELKTPIATVGVAIEALKSFHAMDDPRKTQEYLEISSNELQRLSLMVDKVLRLSLFEKKQIALNKELFNFRQLIADVLATMRPQFERHQAAVSFESDGDDFMISADNLHLTSVVYNLIDNALKYSNGQPLIGIHLSRRRDIFELRVSDKGIGIPKAYAIRVFDKFFRVPNGNRHAVKGYGLGLSYVSEIVRRHSGYISVESEPGKGSTFVVMIPAQEADVIWFDDKRSIRKQFRRTRGGEKR